ncbi:hypothetical protein PGO_010640 [Plasmodium gonderi]|uniref:Ubiquitin-like domain-containing protein n=1 Tax=Plasmodium gonderi TaxID=77519 RepID=A0A1Y1J8T0_PLAGO|nr:hypothetical protein PGO_010640 [Plasmodium gonderi]GAW78916.1 hypothetical protein PGO_010640 [Plasmodium gonderi]
MDEFSKGMMSLPLQEKKDKLKKPIETMKQIQSKRDIPNKQDVELFFNLPSGETLTLVENGGIEVGHLKLKLSKKLEKPYEQILLIYNDVAMLDPLSIIDVIKERDLGRVDIHVRYSG